MTSWERVLVCLTDSTAKRAAEIELEPIMSLLLAAIENSPAGIIIADAPDARIRFANLAALGIRGQANEPLADIPMELHPDYIT